MKPSFLLSYPRSGNTWIRYCVEFLTKYPTIGYMGPKARRNPNYMENGIGKSINIGTNFKLPYILTKRHMITGKEFNSKGIILIIRNYKEAIPGHIKDRRQDQVNRYANLIKYYHGWKKDKFLIYYDDIVLNIENVLTNLINFLEVDVDIKKIKQFMINIQKHKQTSLGVYKRHSRKPRTSGDKNKLIYYSRNLTPQNKKWFDNQMIKLLPNIYEQYIGRYKEK